LTGDGGGVNRDPAAAMMPGARVGRRRADVRLLRFALTLEREAGEFEQPLTIAAKDREPAMPVGERRRFVAGLGVAQIISWGTLYYAFPLIAVAMESDLHVSKPELYGAATFGLAVGSLAAYPVGVSIDRGRGRWVLAAGSVLAAALLLAWSRVASLAALYAIFAGIGVAQAMTLYEAACAVISRQPVDDVRAAITALTLWGGFASTVFVPLTQGLLDTLGWRAALDALASLNLLVCAPLHLAVVGATPAAAASSPAGGLQSAERAAVGAALRSPVFVALAVAFTLYNGAFAALTYHLYPLLLERGFGPAAVVAAIALVGPSQVAARVVVWWLAREVPIRGLGMATVAALPASLLALIALPSSFASIAFFAIVWGTANGVMTIVRSLAVPELVTKDAYGELNGILAVPGAVARAVAPVAAAALWSAAGSYGAVLVAALAMAAVAAASFWMAALYKTRSPATHVAT
jgi:predicted MFS family arabinose efflux permease